jgi:hypothetical protein
MNYKHSTPRCNRRDFLCKVLPAGAFGCLGSSALLSTGLRTDSTTIQTQQSLQNAQLNYREVIQFGLQAYYIPLMKYFADQFGKGNFLDMLKKAYAHIYSEAMIKVCKDIPKKDLRTFTECFGKANLSLTPHIDPALYDRISENSTTYHALKRSDRVIELRVTQCLYADVFRQAAAADIGYIALCYPDEVLAETFAAKLKLYRTKTLMQGHDCCDHKYVYEV